MGALTKLSNEELARYEAEAELPINVPGNSAKRAVARTMLARQGKAEKPDKGKKAPSFAAIMAPFVEGQDLEREIAWRAEVARECDPKNPEKGQFNRVSAFNWIRENGGDLAALGLPIAADLEPEEEEAVTTPHGANLKLTGTDEKVAPPPPSRGFKNAEAEEGLCSGMMTLGDSIPDVVAQVDAEDLGYPHFRYIFAAARDLFDRGEVVDAANVIQEMKRSGGARLELAGGPDAVSAIAGRATTTERFLSHARIVRESADARTASTALDRIKTSLKGGAGDPSAAIAEARELLDRVGGPAAKDARSQVPAAASWPAPPGDDAWHGVVGEIVRAIEPQTEADPNALLGQFLICFGSVVGRNAHWVVNSTRHHTNLFGVIVGPSGVGAKGTGVDITEDVLGGLDHNWFNDCLQSGLSTGEGLIEAVRDRGVVNGVPDEGVPDKRSLWSETEFTKTIACMFRKNSILMETLCAAWDGKPLRSASRANPVRCKKPHISALGQTTIRVIRAVLNDTLKHSGFGNRFLWMCSRRSKELPFGGDVRKLDLKKPLLSLAEAITFGSDPAFLTRPIDMDRKAREIWTSAYGQLTRPRFGGAAPLLDRAHAQVRRLALIYALLDRSRVVQAPHLKAAIAFWDYCERSAEFLFGNPEKDPFADKILAALRSAREKGEKQNDLNQKLFAGKKAAEVESSLRSLTEAGLVEFVVTRGKGRPATTWYTAGFSAPPGKPGKSEETTQPI